MDAVLLLHDHPLLARLLVGACVADLSIRHLRTLDQLDEWLSAGKAVPMLLIDTACSGWKDEPERGKALLSRLPRPISPAVLIVDHADEEIACRADGHQVLRRPGSEEELAQAVAHLRQFLSQVRMAPLSAAPAPDTVPAGLRPTIRRFADLPFPVLIEGESGAGKEAVARALHAEARRNRHPFISVNCAAIAENLIESAFFGHARGAYTGAAQSRAGFFEEAGAGTVFLDEIGDMPPLMQAKLLRVLENGEFVRVGETQARVSRARVVAATHRDLGSMVRCGDFRADLYHRLSVLTLRVAPLRERPDDKLALWRHFTLMLAAESGLAPCQLSAEAVCLWMAYDFPGNVRELRNIVIRLQVRHPGAVISAAQLSPELAHTDNSPRCAADTWQHCLDQPGFRLDQAMGDWQAQLIQAALRRSQGNVSAAARLLGIKRTTLYSRLGTCEGRETD